MVYKVFSRLFSLDSVGRFNLNNYNNLFIETPDIKSEVTEKLTSLDRNWSKGMYEMKTLTDDLKKKTKAKFFLIEHFSQPLSLRDKRWCVTYICNFWRVRRTAKLVHRIWQLQLLQKKKHNPWTRVIHRIRNTRNKIMLFFNYLTYDEKKELWSCLMIINM